MEMTTSLALGQYYEPFNPLPPVETTWPISEAQQDPGIGLEYYPAPTLEDTYNMEDAAAGEPVAKPSGWLGSYWDEIKEAGKYAVKTGAEILKTSLLRPADPNGLAYQTPLEGIYEEQDRADGVIYTPYPRQTNGSVPFLGIGGGTGSGLSPTILLIGAGALWFVLSTRAKK